MAHFRFITRPFTRSFRTPKADSLGSILGLLPPCKDIRPVCQCNRSASLREFSASAEGGPSARVSEIVEEMAGLTLVESSHLMALLCERVDENGLPFMGIMMPGMGSGMGGGGGGGGVAKADEKPAEKTAFDLKLEGFDSGKKVNVIKEVRKFTDLGLKEAKELVEKAPIVLKKGISKEEAEIIIEKLKEVGAKAAME